MLSRFPGFNYCCKCSERCSLKGKLLCAVGKDQRTGCQFCRFKKCKETAGMLERLVSSPNIQNRKKVALASQRKVNTDKAWCIRRNIIVNIENKYLNPYLPSSMLQRRKRKRTVQLRFQRYLCALTVSHILKFIQYISYIEWNR